MNSLENLILAYLENNPASSSKDVCIRLSKYIFFDKSGLFSYRAKK